MEARGMETQEGRVLKRGLKRRHLTMIAIGGSIGTGLFLAMGGTIKDAGPGGAMVAYAVMGIVVYFTDDSAGRNGDETADPRCIHIICRSFYR